MDTSDTYSNRWVGINLPIPFYTELLLCLLCELLPVNTCVVVTWCRLQWKQLQLLSTWRQGEWNKMKWVSDVKHDRFWLCDIPFHTAVVQLLRCFCNQLGSQEVQVSPSSPYFQDDPFDRGNWHRKKTDGCANICQRTPIVRSNTISVFSIGVNIVLKIWKRAKPFSILLC